MKQAKESNYKQIELQGIILNINLDNKQRIGQLNITANNQS